MRRDENKWDELSKLKCGRYFDCKRKPVDNCSRPTPKGPCHGRKGREGEGKGVGEGRGERKRGEKKGLGRSWEDGKITILIEAQNCAWVGIVVVWWVRETHRKGRKKTPPSFFLLPEVLLCNQIGAPTVRVCDCRASVQHGHLLRALPLARHPKSLDDVEHQRTCSPTRAKHCANPPVINMIQNKNVPGQFVDCVTCCHIKGSNFLHCPRKRKGMTVWRVHCWASACTLGNQSWENFAHGSPPESRTATQFDCRIGPRSADSGDEKRPAGNVARPSCPNCCPTQRRYL